MAKYVVETGYQTIVVDDLEVAKAKVADEANKQRLYEGLPEKNIDEMITGPHTGNGFVFYALDLGTVKVSGMWFGRGRILVIECD